MAYITREVHLGLNNYHPAEIKELHVLLKHTLGWRQISHYLSLGGGLGKNAQAEEWI